MLAPRLADRTRDFRIGRIGRLARIAAGDAPVTLMYPDAVVLHVVPFSAFDRDPPLPMAELERNYSTSCPMGSQSSMAIKIKFDGLLTMSNGDRSKEVERAYVQLFRGGIVEAVDRLYVRASGEPLIPVSQTDKTIISNSMRLMRDLSEIKVDPPYAVLVSFLTPERGRFNLTPPGSDSAYYDFMGSYTERAQYNFKEVIFDSLPADFGTCASLMKPSLDQVAHAGGWPASPSFNKDGTFCSSPLIHAHYGNHKPNRRLRLWGRLIQDKPKQRGVRLVKLLARPIGHACFKPESGANLLHFRGLIGSKARPL